jgi:hypothetical protein
LIGIEGRVGQAERHPHFMALPKHFKVEPGYGRGTQNRFLQAALDQRILEVQHARSGGGHEGFSDLIRGVANSVDGSLRRLKDGFSAFERGNQRRHPRIGIHRHRLCALSDARQYGVRCGLARFCRLLGGFLAGDDRTVFDVVFATPPIAFDVGDSGVFDTPVVFERIATDKGVNLLNGLTATLGGDTFAFESTRTENDATTGADSRVHTFTYSPTLLLSATYSLNIFNDNNDHNEVLARPSLIALEGKKSEFFTGAVWHVELDGVSGGQGTVQDVPIGIRLEVTPTFISDDQVQLEVSAARAFIESRSSAASFANFAQVAKTLVTANVVLNFDDTIVISGLSERETEKLHDGVPLLQDIPGLQYFFSHEDTLDYTKSVLVLLTPRKPRYTYADGSPRVDPKSPADTGTGQPNLTELKGRPDWFRLPPNLDSVFEHLKSYQFFKEFRTGDVTLERWNNPVELENRIKQTIEFLYF